MRLADRQRDYWELASAEEMNRAHPDTFPIPLREDRMSLRRGQAAKLIFEIERELDDGTPDVMGERMWVIVAERVGDLYVGILDNEPASIESGDGVYLCKGAEVPFGPEHVIAIGNPPPEHWEQRLAQEPARRWQVQ